VALREDQAKPAAVLKALTVRDFALVQFLDIAFADGLTVITGESGAGKSILLGALGLVLGDRAASDTVRPGAARADVTAEFDLAHHPAALQELEAQALTDPEEPGRCLVRRVVGSDGRSRAFVNGAPATLQTLRTLCEGLVDVHGQHENERLGRREVQLELLDDFGVDAELRRKCRDSYRLWKRADQEAAELAQSQAARKDRAELLTYQLEELDALELVAGEYERIESGHRRLAQAQTLRETAAGSMEALADDPVLGRALRMLDALDDDHPRLAAAREALRAAAELVADAVHDLRAYDDALELDPEALDALDRRLATIHELARKHRVQPAALADHVAQLRAELDGLATDDAALVGLREAAEQHRDAYRTAGRALGKSRRKVAKEFATAVSQCMNTLGIRGGALAVEFMDAENEAGLETIEFHVTTNPKYPAGPLTRIASGGERARISLAIQVVAAARSALPCLVLDEADVGVGGTTADVVGRLLRALAEHTQVICVTHAPQVAALGHHHLRVRKDEHQDTHIEALGPDPRVEELARMLAGADVTDKSRDYARTLLQEATHRPLH
jgi:DNA repair protein RecN (Recombination protein N)